MFQAPAIWDPIPWPSPRNVEDVQATSGAFAAILANGELVTWGHMDKGGDRGST